MRQLIPAAFLLLAACGGADEPALPSGDESPIPVEPDGGIGDGATPAAEPSEATAAGIPEALRGRWGLVAADCEPGRADAKGLLVISADKLKFYESVGTLGEASERTPERMRASFAFTGEGMNWNREMTLEVQDGGKALVRQEFGADAAPAPLRYIRCP
ncbi:MAG TPA: hypothetical protein VL100_03515 [Croceibacterium sp.]|nr:hypothetical protein [Croceibacterium sp.]